MATLDQIRSTEKLLIIRLFKDRRLNRIELRYGENEELVAELNRSKDNREGTDLRVREYMNPIVAENYFNFFPILNNGWSGVWQTDPIP